MPPRSYDWVALRDEWVAVNLALPVPGALSFKEFAGDKDINYEHLRSWASRDRWKDRLTAALTARSEQVTQAVQEVTGEDEAKVRSRHANILRYIGAKALQALRDKTDQDWKRMSLVELVKVAERATSGERDALGLPDRHEFVPPHGGGALGFESVADKLRQHQELLAMGSDFVRYVEMRKRRDARRRAVDGEIVEEEAPPRAQTNADGGTPGRAPRHARPRALTHDGGDGCVDVPTPTPSAENVEVGPSGVGDASPKSDKKFRDPVGKKTKTKAPTRARTRGRARARTKEPA